jgi:phosphohistidine phosphatase SixA
MRQLVLVTVFFTLATCSPVTKPPDSQAPGAPTNQRAVVQSDGTVQLTWTNTTDGDFSRTLVARFLPGGSARKPEGTPAVGDAIGKDGVVIALGAESSFVDGTPPVTCGSVSYRLWSQDTQGRWSDDIATILLQAGATTPPPSQPVTQLSAQAQNRVISITWTNPPTSSGFFQTSLVRKLDSAPTSLADGSLILTTQGSQFSELLSNYPPQTRLFYAAFPCNACGRCQATPATVSFTIPTPQPDGGTDGGIGSDAGLDASVPDAGGVDGGSDAGVPVPDGGGLTPTGLTVTLSPDGQEVRLAWTNSTSPALTSVRVSRTLTQTPDGGQPIVAPAEQVFDGLATQASERVDRLLPSLDPARRYTYRVVGCSSGTCETQGPTASLSLTLKQALRGGGYTVFWRHASASICGDMTQLCPSTSTQTCAQALTGTPNANWWRTCAADPPVCTTTARQLDPVPSQNETMAVRTWFQSNGVTVSRILTSEYCRCFTTAQQFMFGPTLEYSADLTYYVHEESLRCAKTVALLNLTPATGTNIGMVSHAGFFCPTIDSLAWGEAAIFKPQPPSTQTCTTVGSCPASFGQQPACVSGRCVTPMFIARVPALGAQAWSSLP